MKTIKNKKIVGLLSVMACISLLVSFATMPGYSVFGYQVIRGAGHVGIYHFS
jgi:cytochrome c oxidase assembly protein Cox11